MLAVGKERAITKAATPNAIHTRSGQMNNDHAGTADIKITGTKGVKITSRTTSKGTEVCDVTLRLSFFKEKAGEAKAALESGQALRILGKLGVDEWTSNKTGETRYTLDVLADSIETANARPF